MCNFEIICPSCKKIRSVSRLRYELSNGVTLCKWCHAMVDKMFYKFVYKEIEGREQL